MQIIKLHLGLIRYLSRELPKKRTLKDLFKFLKQIIGVYLKELLRLYKNTFLVLDKSYQEKKKQYDKVQLIKKDLNRALKILQYVDNKMQKEGIPRWKMKQFWRDFIKSGQLRQDVFDDLLKDINQIK
jgi:hypothetical protein